MAFTKVTNAGIGSTNTVLLHNLNVVGTVTATDGIFSGIGSFGGNVSVGGVLTYEDVTNVDSVGLITARKGISVLGAGVTIAGGGLNVNAGVSTFGGNVTVGSGITLSPDGDVYVTGVSTFSAVSGTTGTFSGNITANGNIVGDNSTDISGINDVTVSMLSISDTITHTGDTNTKIRFPAADTFAVETAGSESLRVDSSQRLLVGTTSSRSAAAGEHRIQIESNGTNGLSLTRATADAGAINISFIKTRNGAIVQSGDDCGAINWFGDDGTDTNSYLAKIQGMSDGTPGSNDMPGRLVFSTTSDGDHTTTERLRITSSGQLLAGTTSARTNFRNGATGNSTTPQYQFETANDDALNDISLTYGRNNSYGAEIIFAKHRAATVGGTTIVQSGDRLGGITFSGSDGTNFQPAAFIEGEVDGTPGTDDMPGRLVFATTADGAKVPTERLRITSAGAVQLNADTGTHYISVGASQDFKWYHDAGGPTIMSDTGNQGFKLSIKDLNLTDYSGVTSRINLTSGGFVGINQTAPIKMLHVVENNSASGNIVAKFKGGTGADSETFIAIIDGYSDTANDTEGHVKIGAKRAGSGNTAHIVFHTFYSSTMAERMRLTNTGHLFVGCTASPTSSAPGVGLIDDPNQGQIRISTNASGSAVLQMFFNANGNVGDIRTSGSATQYNTSSDYRLKENAVAISDGITRLKTLKPYRFNFKADSSTVVDGFFAHEVTAVPEAITGTKDEVATTDTADELSNISIGDPIYQSIDQSKLVPLLTAALQEEISKREALEARVAALESS